MCMCARSVARCIVGEWFRFSLGTRVLPDEDDGACTLVSGTAALALLRACRPPGKEFKKKNNMKRAGSANMNRPRPSSAAVQRGQLSKTLPSETLRMGMRRPNTAGGARDSRRQQQDVVGERLRNGQHSHMVVLDGYAMPNIDPNQFSHFWEQREETRRQEASRRRTTQPPGRPVSAPFYSGQVLGKGTPDGEGLHYPTGVQNNSASKRTTTRRGRPSTAPGGKRKEIHPGSAAANLMARMAMAGPDADAYRANLEKTKMSRPKSSRDHIRRRAAQRRKAAQEFADKMAEEEKLIQQDIISRVQEATKYARVLKLDKKFKHIFDKEGNLQIEVLENQGVDVSIVSTQIFNREHAKLQKHAVAAGLFGDKVVTKGKKQSDGEGSAKPAGNNMRPTQRPRAQVLMELKQILADTESLTSVLDSQLNELEERGWNRGFV